MSSSHSSPARFEITDTPRGQWIAFVVLAIMLFVAGWATLESWRHAGHDARDRLERDLGEEAITLAERMRAYEQGLLAATALFLRDGRVSRDQWQAFDRHIDFTARSPGVLALGFAPLVPGERRAGFEQQHREEGLARFRVHPDPDPDVSSAPVLYIEPVTADNLAVLGFDLLSEPTRRSAALLSADTGKPVLSGRLTLLQEKAEGTPGVILFAPVYRPGLPLGDAAQRRAALQGWAYLAFRSEAFISGTLSERAGSLGLAVYAGDAPGAGQKLFSNLSNDDPAGSGALQARLDVPGGHWLLVGRAAALPGSVDWRSVLVAVLGTGLAITLFVLTLFLSRTRDRALAAVRSRENELRRSHQFLHAVVDAIPVPLFVKDAQHRLVLVNDAQCAMHGRTREEMIGRTDAQMYTPDLVERNYAQDDRALASADPLFSEERTVSLDRQPKWILKAKAGVTLADGSRYVAGIIIDITQRRAAELEAEANRELLTKVLDASPSPLMVKDQAGRWLFVNESGALFLGGRPEDFIGRQPGEVYGSTAAARAAEGDRAALGRDEEVVSEGDILGIDGVARYGIERKRGVTLSDGRRLVLVSMTDLQARRRAELEAAASRSLLTRVLDAIPVAVVLKDSAHRFIVLNRAWEALHGRSASEMLGCNDLDVHGEVLGRQRLEEDTRVLRTGETILSETAQVDGNGIEHFGMRKKQRIELADGRPGILVTFYDLTERRKAELELERTRELEAAKEMAEAANHTKSEFLANMSHELRTPLHAILSFARLGEERLTQRPPPVHKFEQYFMRIQQSGDRLLVLLNDLLDLAKLEAGKMRYDLGRCDIRAVLLAAVQELSALAGARGVTLSLCSSLSDSHAWCDGVKIGQVARNLLSNAIKFSPVGGTVTVSMEETGAAEAPELMVSVCDEGPGIPVEELESIFDKFVQSSQTKSGAGGTGLGLAICQRIVQDQGGHIWAENLPAHGARLAFLLPRSAPTRLGAPMAAS